jgi:hypothetical protein
VSHLVSPPLGASLRPGGDDGADPRARAYGDELLQDRRLRSQYRRLKQNWLSQGREFFRKIRRRPRDRHMMRLESGLESMYRCGGRGGEVVWRL